MPKNAEFVIAAFSLVVGVIGFYGMSIRWKLASVKSKLKNLVDRETDAQ